MKITNVEILPIYPKLAPRNANQKVQFQRINHRVIFKVETDNGIVGYGDARGLPPTDDSVAHVVDRSPFDFVNGHLNVGLLGAMYDAMGKHLEIPAYKLMGQKVRDRVPVAAWTRPSSPEDLAKEVIRAGEEGYKIFKLHTCAYYDVLEQNAAVEEVAPDGFQMHYDFNHNRSLKDVLRIIHRLEASPLVGMIEDPLVWRDLDGWRLLRSKCRIPLLMHQPQLGCGPEIMHECADAYMVGEMGLGISMVRAIACAAANVSTVIQLTGGTLTKAMAMHMGAVLPVLSYSINLDDQYGEDIVQSRLAVEEGSTPVPEGPGLGVEVDETALKRLAATKPNELPTHLGVLHLPGGRRLYTPSIPNVSKLTGFPEGGIRGIRHEIWEDDSSDAFQEMYARVQAAGSVFE